MGSVKEDIAKLDYMWRYCGVPDEYEYGWEEETDSIKSNCREFATQILSLVCKRIEGALLTVYPCDGCLQYYKPNHGEGYCNVDGKDKGWHCFKYKKWEAQTAQLQHCVDVIKEE